MDTSVACNIYMSFMAHEHTSLWHGNGYDNVDMFGVRGIDLLLFILFITIATVDYGAVGYYCCCFFCCWLLLLLMVISAAAEQVSKTCCCTILQLYMH